MTPWEMRESYIDSILSEKEVEALKENKMYQRYVFGEISIDEVYANIRDSGV